MFKIKLASLLTTIIAGSLLLTACGGNGSSHNSANTASTQTPPITNTNPTVPVVTNPTTPTDPAVTPVTPPTTPVVTPPITPANQSPIAVAGNSQNVNLGDIVKLDGSASSDPDKNLLTYQWSIISKPDTSTVELSDKSVVAPTFKPDLVGEYIIALVVNDGNLNSPQSTVTINVVKENAAPTAVIATLPSEIQVSKQLTLDGSKSTDSDNDTLSYVWTLENKPDNSQAQLSLSTTSQPSIIFDKEGDYTFGLVVSDGKTNSTKTTASIKVTRGNSIPIANAGDNQTVKIGQVVNLNGNASSDPDGDNLTYQWKVTSLPANSHVTVDSPTAFTTFTPDVAGDYVFTLTLSDGIATASKNVTITAQSLPKIILSNVQPWYMGGGDTVLTLPYDMAGGSFSGSSSCVGRCDSNISLGDFSLEAQNGDFTITNLTATSDNPNYSALFDGLTNNQVISAGNKVKFSLKFNKTNGNTVNLTYSFTIKETGDTFKYSITANSN